jgi:hypothetical protein
VRKKEGFTAIRRKLFPKFGSGAHVAEARRRAAALETQGRKDVPTIDIQKTCQAAAGVMISLMGGTTTEQDINSCLDSEQKARDQLVKDRATYSSAQKAQCIQTDVYLPSYVEWLTCLEMERDVRQERQQDVRKEMQQDETFGQGGPYTLPRVSPATNSAGRATPATKRTQRKPVGSGPKRP